LVTFLIKVQVFDFSAILCLEEITYLGCRLRRKKCIIIIIIIIIILSDTNVNTSLCFCTVHFDAIM